MRHIYPLVIAGACQKRVNYPIVANRRHSSVNPKSQWSKQSGLYISQICYNGIWYIIEKDIMHYVKS